MTKQEQLKQSLIGNWRDKNWEYKSASDHADATKFRERMEARRKIIPVTATVKTTVVAE